MLSITIVITPELAGQAVDLAIVQAGSPFSRRRIRRLLDKGQIHINKQRVRVASTKTKVGDRVVMFYEEGASEHTPTPGQLGADDIIYERGAIIAVNKPAGMLSEAPDHSPERAHVLSLLTQYLDKRDQKPSKLHLCHRLDRETSGILLVGKNQSSTNWLNTQFRERTIAKTYWAIAYGVPAQAEWEINCNLTAIHKEKGRVEATHAGGRPSQTFFKLLKSSPQLGISLIECRPVTGRSHQIRIHLELSGCPIVGDKRYGGQPAKPLPEELARIASEHHLLHAYRLRFRPTPKGEAITLEAPLPKNFGPFVQALA